MPIKLVADCLILPYPLPWLLKERLFLASFCPTFSPLRALLLPMSSRLVPGGPQTYTRL